MTAAGEVSPDDANDHVWSHLFPTNQVRLSIVLREQIPEVFRLTRAIEQQTSYSSEIGKNMLVDVLSHLGTLAESRDLTAEEEASQLAKIEEHIRRAIIEHPEEVVRNRIVDVRELWSIYHREAFPYRASNELHGVPLHRALEEKRTRIDVLLESARATKPSEVSWKDSLNAAAEMTEAAHLTQELANDLDQCIGVAQKLTNDRKNDRRTNRQWVIGVVIAIILAIAGCVTSYEVGKSSAPSLTPGHSQSSVKSP
jgi:phage terminase small subunit